MNSLSGPIESCSILIMKKPEKTLSEPTPDSPPPSQSVVYYRIAFWCAVVLGGVMAVWMLIDAFSFYIFIWQNPLALELLFWFTGSCIICLLLLSPVALASWYRKPRQ